MTNLDYYLVNGFDDELDIEDTLLLKGEIPELRGLSSSFIGRLYNHWRNFFDRPWPFYPEGVKEFSKYLREEHPND